MKTTNSNEITWNRLSIFEKCQSLHVEDAVQIAEDILREATNGAYASLAESGLSVITDGEPTPMQEVFQELNGELDLISDWWDALDWCDRQGIDETDSLAFVHVLAM